MIVFAFALWLNDLIAILGLIIGIGSVTPINSIAIKSIQNLKGPLNRMNSPFVCKAICPTC